MYAFMTICIMPFLSLSPLQTNGFACNLHTTINFTFTYVRTYVFRTQWAKGVVVVVSVERGPVLDFYVNAVSVNG